MNQVLVTSLGLVIALLLLGLGKKPNILFARLNQTKGFSKQRDETITLIANQKSLLKKENIEWEPPRSPIEEISLKKNIRAAMLSHPDARLKAIKIADHWGDKWVIPILKRGLKDSDSRVVCAAAIAITKYKSNKKITQAKGRPPLNVALMR